MILLTHVVHYSNFFLKRQHGSNQVVHILIFKIFNISIIIKFKKLQWSTFFGISERNKKEK